MRVASKVISENEGLSFDKDILTFNFSNNENPALISDVIGNVGTTMILLYSFKWYRYICSYPRNKSFTRGNSQSR